MDDCIIFKLLCILHIIAIHFHIKFWYILSKKKETLGSVDYSYMTKLRKFIVKYRFE